MVQKLPLVGHKAANSVSPTCFVSLVLINCTRYLSLISSLLKSIMPFMLQRTLKAENSLDIKFFEVGSADNKVS